MVDFIEFYDFSTRGRGSKWSIVLNFFRLFDFSTRGGCKSPNILKIFDYSTRGGGSKWSMVLNLFYFSTRGRGGAEVGSRRGQKSMVRMLGIILLTLSKKMGIFFIFEVKMGKPLAK